MTRSAMFVVALILAATPAFGQTADPVSAPGLWRYVSFAPVSGATAAVKGTAGITRSTPAQAAVERHGFTILVNLGMGVQHDTSFGDTAVGLGGANIGVGAFITNRIAVLGRFSGTNVTYEFDGQQVSGVLGATVQYWLSDRFHLEAGGGIGYWNWDLFSESETGAGLILGAGVTVFERGHHNLQVGAEYAPVFTDLTTVHNFCVTFGYQFHK